MKTSTILYFALAIFLSTTLTYAAPIIDQEHDPSGNYGAGAVGHNIGQIQTFTVGISGVLTGIDVQVGRGSSTVEPLLMSVCSTDISGLPDQVLASGTAYPSDTHPNLPRPFVTFDLSNAALSVLTGDYLAIVLQSDALNISPFTERYDWEKGGEYALGVGYMIVGASIFEHTDDFHFKTYVSAVPIPSSIILLTSSLILLGFKKRTIT